MLELMKKAFPSMIADNDFRIRTQKVKTFGGQIKPLAVLKNVCFQVYNVPQRCW